MIEDAYAAGIFDADGFVSIRYNPEGKQWYNPMASITQLHPELLDEFHSKYGGRLYEGEYCTWTLNGLKAKPFLEAVYPYLILKSERVKYTLELLKTYEGMRGRHMTSAIMQQRKELAEKIRHLQDKGRVIYTDGTIRKAR